MAIATVPEGSTVTPLRKGENRLTDAMFDGHLRRTGHTLVANRITPPGAELSYLNRHCC